MPADGVPACTTRPWVPMPCCAVARLCVWAAAPPAVIDPPGPGVPVPLAVAVAVRLAQRAARALGRAGGYLGLGLHDPLGGEGQHVSHQVGVGALLDQFQKGHSLLGHCRSPVR